MRRPLPVLSLCLACALPAAAQVSSPAFNVPGFQLEPSVPWMSAGNGETDNHFAPGEFILGPYTLPFVTEKWVFSANGEVQGTPTVEGNAVYIADAGGTVWRLDARDGSAVWQASLPAITGNQMSYSRNSPAIGDNVVIVGDQASGAVFALSKADGTLVWQKTLATNKGAIVTSSPVIVGGQIYVGVASDQETMASKTPNFVPDFRGSVAALEEATGNILWQTYTIPAGFTGGAVWASNMAVDTNRQVLYVTSGNNYTVPASVAACQAAATTPTQLDACLPADDHIDSILALNLKDGSYKWSQRLTHADTWTVSCISKDPATPCPTPTGLDTDFGAGANLFTIHSNGTAVDAVGAGQKSGAYYALNRDTGAVLWGTQVGPDGDRGGVEWGTATDGQRIYVPISNSNFVQTTLQPSGQQVLGGFWSALDPATGQILWQTPTLAPAPPPSSEREQVPPAGATASAEGSVSVANGILYGEDTAGNFVALDTTTGQVLRSVQSGGSAIAAPAIVDGTLYWPSGYVTTGATNNKVYAFWTGLQ